ncbi:MAG: hypothetical protein JW749_12120 [Sedimentisphaerales bacterium]|nr:hypothetical protein [Sedimentisphaerales bacterium]
MNLLMILAQTSKAPGNFDSAQVDYGTKYVLQALDAIWQQATALTWQQAVIAIAFGSIPLLYGWRIYKLLTVIGFGLLGIFVGKWAGTQLEQPIIGAIVGAITLSIVALPLMRWAVCVLGAVAGGVITSGIWYSFFLPQQYVWAGAMMGIVAGGMLSFAILKLSVMFFTSFAGSSLVILGTFALIYRYETFVNDPPTTHLNELFYGNHLFLTILLICSVVFGIILQFKLLKESKDWSV